MRVLHVVSTLHQGGIASSLWHVLPYLRIVSGVDVEIAALYSTGHFGRLLAGEGVPVQCLQLKHRYDPRALSRLVNLIRRGGYDIVHAHGWPEILYVAVISLVLPGRSYVLGEHNVTNRRRRRGLKPLDRFVYGRYDRITAISEAVRNALVAWLPELASRTSTVHYGIEPAYLIPVPDAHCAIRAELGIRSDVSVVLSGGGLEYQKGIDTLLHALVKLASTQASSGPPITNHQPMTLIAGDGAMRSQIEALASSLGLNDRVLFLGFRPDMPSLMAAADLFVLSSRWEGCPMVVLEAMAIGTPIVATTVGRVPELMADGAHGRPVPPEDPEALADAIARMLSCTGEAAAMADRAQLKLKRDVTVDAYAKNLEAIYEAMIDEAQRS